MNAPIYIPERGDLAWIDFDPQTGHEQAGRRPGVVLTRAAYNGRIGLAVVCPITSRPKGYPFEVMLPSGLPIYGVVLCDQVRSLDWRVRRAAHIGQVPEPILADIITAVETLVK